MRDERQAIDVLISLLKLVRGINGVEDLLLSSEIKDIDRAIAEAKSMLAASSLPAKRVGDPAP